MTSKRLVYVIQEHYATHHHFDLRLEREGVLKSWAIPKEPPENKGEKRLAIEVPDHPLGYEKFEGKIPEGQYGAGFVETWDSGTYELIEETAAKLLINIHGKKLKGIYHLIKFSAKEGKPNKNWLLFRS